MKENNISNREIDKLVSDNLNFVKAVANQYVGKGLDFDDLTSEGYMAMLEAAQKFDATRGNKFVSYAAPFIHKAMERAIEQQAGICRIPKTERKFTSRSSGESVSIDQPLSEGGKISLLDIIINKDALLADESTEFRLLMKDLQDCISYLDEREKEVVEKFYGIGRAHVTLAEIGDDMNLKRERVRQIRDKALRKISKNAKTKALKVFLKK